MATTKKKISENANFHVIVGSDDGMVREEALVLYNELTGGNDDGFTHETIDGNADNSEGAYEICASTSQSLMTMPMFGGDKVVWLRNVNFLGDDVTGRSQRPEAGVEMLRGILEKGLPNGIKFLISADKIDKRKSFWKFLEKSATVQSYDKIDISKDGWQGEVGRLRAREAIEDARGGPQNVAPREHGQVSLSQKEVQQVIQVTNSPFNGVERLRVRRRERDFKVRTLV